MNLEFSPEDNAFREEVRTFIEENYPEELANKEREEFSKEEFLA